MIPYIKKHWHWFTIIGTAVVVMILVFSVNGLHDRRVDADIYAGQIRSFADGTLFDTDPVVMLRISKPLYPILALPFAQFFHPYDIILAFDIIAYLGFAVLMFMLLELLGFTRRESVIGTIWIITGYPLLKYGLALSTDMSGWLFAVATLIVGLQALKKDSLFLLSLASIVGFIGAIAKETGALGLIALGLLVLWRSRKQGMPIIVKRSAALVLPALILYAVMLSAIVGKGPTFLTTYKEAGHYFSEYYSLTKLAAVEFATFNVLWILAIAGFWARFKSRVGFPHVDFLIVAFIAALPPLLWPIFVSRIIYIQFLWVVPLALLGFRFIQAKIPGWVVVLTPVAVSVSLFLISSGGSLFDLLH